MSVVIIVGVNHFDPLGPRKVRKYLDEIKAQGFCPEYVCVEWKKEIADEVIKQRIEFGDMVKSRFPNIRDEDALEFEKSLAYEADSHVDTFPEAGIIWLEANRDIDSTDSGITEYSKHRFKKYRNYDINSTIEDISREVLAENNRYTPGYRDVAFFEAVQAQTNCNCDILCIVGASHGDVRAENSFAFLMKANGYEVVFFDTTRTRSLLA